MKEFLIILRRNSFSPVVIAILALAVVLLIVGERRDAWFISVVIVVNTLIAVIQEVRAQRALHKLELLSAPQARLINPDGTETLLPYDQLQADALIRLQNGDEVPADATIVASKGLEVNESMLTGESASVEKDKGAFVYASSSVVAGSAEARVVSVGTETKAGVMTSKLKRYTPQLTPLQKAINRAITFLTYGALVLAVLILAVYYVEGYGIVTTLKTITSAAVTIIPEGLLLASTLLLAFGSLHLMRAKVLPQKLAATEAMALLTVLCVDKTGTLTSDVVKFESIQLAKHRSIKAESTIKKILGIVSRETSGGSGTGAALEAALYREEDGIEYTIDERMAFSSVRKMSGARVRVGEESYSVILGAPEYVAAYAPLPDSWRKVVADLAKSGKRVLYAVTVNDASQQLKKLVDNTATPLALIILSNPLRTGVKETVSYLQKNGVSIRVISGDNPDTVSYIASEAGIKNASRVITGAELDTISEKDWAKTVARTTIFARVLPEQKEKLVQSLREQGEFVGMVGDGVNDALALKQADFGVAMFAGAAASRRVADIVLLNNSFTALPLGMKVGNQIMQAIELIAMLFFHKIIYGAILLLGTLAIGAPYPFAPRHVTFMNIFFVTLPTIIWTLFPPVPRSKITPRHFWRDTLLAIAPIAFVTGVSLLAFYQIASHISSIPQTEVATATVLVATFFGVYMVFLTAIMQNVRRGKKARIAAGVYILAAAITASLAFGFNVTRNFFDFTRPAFSEIWPALVIVAFAAVLQFYMALVARRKYRPTL